MKKEIPERFLDLMHELSNSREHNNPEEWVENALEIVRGLKEDARALRVIVFAAAEIVDSCVHQIDLIFPNDAEPQMQQHLHEMADQLCILSESPIGSLQGPYHMLALATKEERLKKESLETELTELKKKLQREND